MPMTRLRRAAASLLGAASGLAFLMLASGPASAQTLTEALTQAYSSNPQLLAERARLRATDEELNQANAGWRAARLGQWRALADRRPDLRRGGRRLAGERDRDPAAL